MGPTHFIDYAILGPLDQIMIEHNPRGMPDYAHVHH